MKSLKSDQKDFKNQYKNHFTWSNFQSKSTWFRYKVMILTPLILIIIHHWLTLLPEPNLVVKKSLHVNMN